jgi:tetratricopeptide (TPR) repeat protein
VSKSKWLVFAAAGVFALAACDKASSPPAESKPGAAPAPAARADHDATHGGPPQSLADWARGAKLYDGLGNFHRTVTTSSQEAQQYFDQGMRLMWAFNHDEATRSFARAAELDPTCAMCFWGVALTVGPNYNLPVMAEPRAKVAWDALQKAQTNAGRGTPVEQSLIAALAQRYRGPQPLDPSNSGPVLKAHAEAMRAVATRFPEDLDAQVLFAEAMMDTNAWKLWTVDGKAAPGTSEIQSTLEKVLAKSPAHPGANHYYVHTMEASRHPDLALASAERLTNMMPSAGHLQHMPAHIMQRVGRYEDASRANRDGVVADKAYMAATSLPDYYGMYFAHNYQFLAYSAAMEGRKAEAMDAAKKMQDTLPVEMMLAMPGVDWSMSETYSVMKRFGLWDEILAEKAPDPKLNALTAAYHHARAVAFSEKGKADDARAEIARLEKIVAATPPDAGAGLNVAKDVFAVALADARGHLARAEGRLADAESQFRAAVALEDKLAYDEPADWFLPVRHELGALLLKEGKNAEAEAVYRADLVQHPKNGWALFGLAKSLEAQKKSTAAAEVERQFDAAWKHADVKLTSSVF